ncbi:hypothetical protein R6Q59_012110, partial [Mikania micrantha]
VFVGSSKANNAVTIYKLVFGAEEVNHVSHPMRKAGHHHSLLLLALIKLGSTCILIFDVYDDSTAS